MEDEELIAYFKNTKLPTEPIRINKYATIADPAAFVVSNLAKMKRDNVAGRQARQFLTELRAMLEPSTGAAK